MPARGASLCGHVRCYALNACAVGLAPPLETLRDQEQRAAVRAAYADMMMTAMRDDPSWTLQLARLATLDGTRPPRPAASASPAPA